MNKADSDLEQKKSNETSSYEEDNSILTSIKALPSVEDQLREAINQMRVALAQEGSPDFKTFWIVRKLCLSLFQDILSSPVRSFLWKDYIELTKEGRRLKLLIDEETSFAIDQIDLAITSLEKDIELFNSNEQGFLSENSQEEFYSESVFLQNSSDFYKKHYSLLSWLNIFVSKISNLRKELIKTDMRVRFKNRFFQRLSALGDAVFPKRKILIKEVSDFFAENIKKFVDTYFENQDFTQVKDPRKLFFLRNEIKFLQNTAKILILNSQVFSMTRALLSRCWDQLKGVEKDIKKKKSVHKKVSVENVFKVQEKIRELETRIENEEISLEKAFSETFSISNWMRELDFVHQDVMMLKDSLKAVLTTLNEKKQEIEKVRKQQEEEQEVLRKNKVEEFKKNLEKFEIKITDENIRNISSDLEEIKKEVLNSDFLLKSERLFFEKIFKTFKEKIIERQEAALLLLSEDDKAALDNLNQVLSQRKIRRKVLKTQIEEYRKIIGGSGFDFEKAMYYDSLIQVEKEKLVVMDAGIKDLEKKIVGLKQKVT